MNALRAASTTTCRCSPRRAATSRSASNSSRRRPRRWRRRCGSRSRRSRRSQPRFVSVTYGAGGSTRERTHATVERILKETSLTPAAHLTCVGASRDEVDAIARDYWDLGVRNIVALRGDPPEPGTKYQPHPDGYRDAAELVAGLKEVAPFDISVAAYPEVHPDSSIARVRPRESEAQGRRRRRPRDHPILLLAGLLLPLPRRSRRGRASTSRSCPASCRCRTSRTTRRFAADVRRDASREWLDELFEGLDDLPAARQLIAATVAAELCGQLYAGGVRHFHFYTLNRAELSYAICHLLGVRAQSMSAAADLPRRSRQAHPDQGRRLRHRDPGASGCRAPTIAAGSTC